MMSDTTHLRATDPTCARIGALVGYSGQHYQARPYDAREPFVLYGAYWSEGTREAWSLYSLSQDRLLPLPGINPLRDRDQSIPADTLPADVLVIQETQGSRYPHVTIHYQPGAVSKLLPEPTSLTTEESIVLAATAGLKPSYGVIKDLRFHEAHRETGIAREAWDAAKAELIRRKMLNAAGAITVEGRNAIGGTRLGDIRRELRKVS